MLFFQCLYQAKEQYFLSETLNIKQNIKQNTQHKCPAQYYVNGGHERKSVCLSDNLGVKGKDKHEADNWIQEGAYNAMSIV